MQERVLSSSTAAIGAPSSSFKSSAIVASTGGAESDSEDNTQKNKSSKIERLGVPPQLLPFYAAFMLDAVAVGLVMPALPFLIMEKGANALQLSLVVSANYVAQSVGVIVMGRVSDRYGRRVVFVCCLLASALSYISLSQSFSLRAIAASRVISGSFGGLLPVLQSTVADVAQPEERTKYLGRITAVFGLGFIIGPALSTALSVLSTREKILFASLLPMSGFAIVYAFGAETKQTSTPSAIGGRWQRNRSQASSQIAASEFLSPSTVLLVINGFAIMYAFATETIYSMFIKDRFGFGESSLSLLFVFNGMLIGVFQVFCIKPIVRTLGDCATLALGDLLLAAGMIGFALVRQQTLHFMFFSLHLVGFSMAETTVVELIARNSSSSHQGRHLAYNQAAQSAARVMGPLLAGFLYEFDKEHLSESLADLSLPIGSLPFLAGAMLPAFALIVPFFLYLKELSNKPKSVQSAV